MNSTAQHAYTYSKVHTYTSYIVCFHTIRKRLNVFYFPNFLDAFTEQMVGMQMVKIPVIV